MSTTFPANDPRPGLCKRRRKDGEPCGARAVAGTDSCRKHAGIPAAKLRAKGAVVVELRNWGLGDSTIDPGELMLRLVTQSAARVEFYSGLLQQAYAAAERLREAESADIPGAEDLAHSARLDLERVLNTGGVAALIGHTYSGTQQNGVIATGEKIRGLAALESEERDRAMNFAAKAFAAGVTKRMVEMAEQEGRTLATVILGVLTDLGLPVATDEVRRLIGVHVARATGLPLMIEGSAA